MELSIKSQHFELTYGLTDLFIRVGAWSVYWNLLHGLTIG